MGQPEAEEDEVEAIACGGAPLEQVGDDVLDPFIAHTGAVSFDCLRRRIHRHQPFGARRQVAGPQARAAGQLEDPAARARGFQLCLHFRQLCQPHPALCVTAVVAALAEKPLVVLGRPRPVVGDLLRQ